MKGRPRVPSSLFTRIYNYHKSYGGKFDVVNDIGAGIGNFSIELAKRFTEVVVIEPNIKSLGLARKHLIPGGTCRSRFQFVNGKAEDDLWEPESVDMVFAANLMYWVELERALNAIAKQLKPGRTFFTGL
jgi:trans-aconitate 3-methyltransferase